MVTRMSGVGNIFASCWSLFYVLNLVFSAGFCDGPFYPPARHDPGETQLGFQPVRHQ